FARYLSAASCHLNLFQPSLTAPAVLSVTVSPYLSHSHAPIGMSEVNGISEVALAGVLFVSLDDHLDEAVAHDIFVGEVDELDAFDACEHALGFDETATAT